MTYQNVILLPPGEGSGAWQETTPFLKLNPIVENRINLGLVLVEFKIISCRNKWPSSFITSELMEGDSINSDYMSKCFSLGILRSWGGLQNNQIWRGAPLLFPDSIQLHSSPIPSRLSCSLRRKTKALARELFHELGVSQFLANTCS